MNSVDGSSLCKENKTSTDVSPHGSIIGRRIEDFGKVLRSFTQFLGVLRTLEHSIEVVKSMKNWNSKNRLQKFTILSQFSLVAVIRKALDVNVTTNLGLLI